MIASTLIVGVDIFLLFKFVTFGARNGYFTEPRSYPLWIFVYFCLLFTIVTIVNYLILSALFLIRIWIF